LMLPKEDRNYATRSELLDKLKVAMGGRVAEEIVLNEISTGASQDIQQASRIVRSMIMQYGMSDVLGPVAYGSDTTQQFFGQNPRNYSEEVAGEIDKEVHKYMEDAYQACRDIINKNRDKLDIIAQALMERETLTAAELKAMVFGENNGGQSLTVNLNKDEILNNNSADDVAQLPQPIFDSNSPTPV